MISDEKKEEVRAAADLVEVVGDHVRLKRSGSGFVGLCPFHEEKTPSFSVTPRLGIYKCFGCGASGDIFRFVMEMEGVGFLEAVRTLADRYGVHLPEEESAEPDPEFREREGVYHALRFAGLFFFRQLKESPEAEEARAYLERRGYDRAVIRKFGLGFSPPGGEALLKAALREGISEEYLHKADLIKPSQRGEGWYDTFRGRLMFPIFNPSGKVIAFAGRVTGNQKAAKYINSAQTLVYNKSEVVYGVNFSRNEIRRQEEVILVEGYTDVITLAQHGIANTVASAGTALTPQQIRVLKRYASRLLMIYDSDSAGVAAMMRGMEIALAEGMEVNLLALPDQEDPDSFVRKYGGESFHELKRKETTDFVTFRIQTAEEQGEMESPGGRARVIATVLETIAEIPDGLERQVYVQHLHQKTQRYRNASDRELFEQLSLILSRKEEERKRKRRQAGRKANEGAVGPASSPGGPMSEPMGGSMGGPVSGQPGEGAAGRGEGHSGFPGTGPHRDASAFSLPIPAGPPDAPWEDSLMEAMEADPFAPHPAAHSQAARGSGRSGGEFMPGGRIKRPPSELELLRLMLEHGAEMVRYVEQHCREEYLEDQELREFYLDIFRRHHAGEEAGVEHYRRLSSPWPELLGEVLLERYKVSDRYYERAGTRFQRDRDPFRVVKSTLRKLRLDWLEREMERLALQLPEADLEMKKMIVEQQKEIQSEISRIERIPAGELYPDPEGRSGGGAGPGRFEYRMKNG